ncbi:MAG: response regulator transcription factor [Chloroflexota bacterium]
MATVAGCLDEAAAPATIIVKDRSITILIVDDHPMVRSGARIMLDLPGLEVIGEASSGPEAISFVKSRCPDIVLMDVGMPGMDGLEATVAVRAACPRSAVIIVTGDPGNGFVRSAVNAGAIGYLRKGASREMLVQAVRLAVTGVSLFDSDAIASLGSAGTDGATGNDETEKLLSSLSPREVEVLRHVAAGLGNKEIASTMNYSVGTVKNVIQRVIEKLGAADRTQAAVFAVRAGL